MTSQIPIDELAKEIAKYLSQSVPLTIGFWDAKTISEYLKVSQRHVAEHIVFLPGFPKAIRLPSIKGLSHRRWKASEVIKWVESFEEK